VADVPTGISGQQIRKSIAELRAFGEIMKVPPPQLEPILDRAEKEMRERPESPPGTPGPPGPPGPP